MGIPDDIPEADLWTLFSGCAQSRRLEAKEILVQYVIYKYNVLEPRPVWIVSLRGIPPLEGIGHSIAHMPVYTHNRIREIVNPNTGKMSMSTTVPNVPLTPEDRKRILGY